MALSGLDTTKIANGRKRSIGFDGRTRDTQHFAGSGNGIDSLQVIHRLQKATQVELWWLKGNTHDVGSCWGSEISCEVSRLLVGVCGRR